MPSYLEVEVNVMTTKMLVMLVMLMVMMNDNNGNDDDNDDDNLPSCSTWQVEPIEISKPATVEPPSTVASGC